MSKLKSTLIKLSAVVFALSVSLAIAFMPKISDVDAADGDGFGVSSSSIRVNPNEPFTGLKFTYLLQDGWYAKNDCTGATVAALIFPAKNGEVDTTKSATDNMIALDGDNIICGYYNIAVQASASIVFDDDQIKQLIAEKRNYRKEDNSLDVSKVTAEDLNAVKAGLFAMEFTVYPYAIANGKTIWATAPFTTSMQKVAASTLVSIDQNPNQDKDGKIREAALKYVGGSYSYHEGYATVSDGKVYLDGIDGYQASEDAIASLGNVNAQVENGEIYLNGELTASSTPQKLYIFENGSLKIVNLLLVDNVITSGEDFVNYVDPSKWAEGDNPFKKITVLGRDIDMKDSEAIYSTSTKDFYGTFDGRGHVISNLTVAKTVSGTVYSPIFGNLQNSAIIKNVAFDEITSLGYNVNSGILTNHLRGTVENIYVKFSKTSEVQQIFMYTEAGHLTNCIIEAPYNEDLDVDKWILDHDADWGRTYLARMIHTAATSNMTNVKVITQLPLILYGEGNMAEPAYTDGAVSNWKNWFAYGENESKLWYDFEYFYNATDDAEKPGLGLEKGTANVGNTQVIVNDQSMKQGKTRVWKGVERYETLDEMVANDDLSAFVNSGMWKMENGKLVWAKGENVTTYIGGDYEAAENKLMSTAINGEVVKKITVNGVELSRENGEYTVDENGYLTSIYGKKSATDPKNGISYKLNSADNDILDEVIIFTETGKYELSFANYYTKVIDTAAELKQVLEIDYTIVASPATPRTSQNGIVYNTHTDGKEYVYNAGIYKLGANIDMYNAETQEYLAIDYSTITLTNKDYYGYHYYDASVILGGFTGAFDGDGYVISNFKPSKYGMFGILATTGSSLTIGADIKNVAFTNVLTTSADLRCPVIAAQMYNSDTIAQNISNVYVTYSASATDMYGLVYQPAGVLKMSNVYVVNETMYNAIDEGLKDNYYGIELEEGAIYRNVFARGVNTAVHEHSSSLFGSIRNMKNIGTSYINNVLVASPNLINYNNNFDFAMQSTYAVQHVSRTYTFASHFNSRINCGYREQDYYYCSNCGYYYATAECTRCGADAVIGSKVAKKTSSKARSFGFAGNEVTSTVPVIKGFAPSIIKDIATVPYKDESGTLINPFSALAAASKPGYVCDTCGKHISLIKDSKCYDETCEGTMNVQATIKNGLTYENYNGVWASPYAYEWALYDLTARASTNTISDGNAIVRFMGVTRYDTASEINEKVDFSSFKGSKVWAVTENGLTWASLVA